MSFNMYYQHYVTVRDDGVIIDGWSNGPCPEKDTKDAICIDDKGTYHFQLYRNGEVNPPIRDEDGFFLYRWDGSRIVNRQEDEIEAERRSIPLSIPTKEEQLRADVDFIAVMLGVKL